MKLDGYIRVSDVHGRGGESFISPDVQRDAILGWAKLHGHEIAVMHEELDVSGGKTDRPLLNELMRRIEAGETEGVVVWKLDRFGRTLVGCLELLKRIQDAGANFASVTDQFDLSTPNGRLVLNMMLSIAQFELERIGASWREARARATGRGRHMGGFAPFGYRKRPDGRLEPDPVRGPSMTEVFSRRAGGHSWYAIAAWLAAEGVVTARGHRLTSERLKRLSENEVFLGVLVDRVSGVRLEGAHPPLTDRATFAAVQGFRGVRRTRSEGDHTETVLRGLVRCAGCRYTMNTTTGGASGFLYRCVRLHNGACPRPVGIRATGEKRAQGLDAYVLERVFERLPEVEAEAFGADTEVNLLDEAARQARAELHGYLSDRDLERVAGREAFLAGAESRRLEAEQAEEALAEALRQHAGRLQPSLRRLRDDWDRMTLQEQRTALAGLIQAVFIGPASNGAWEGASAGRVHIVWFDDPKPDLPRQGRRDFVARPFVFPDADHPDDVGVMVA